GRYPFRTHMTSNGTGALVKPENEVMLPTVLKAAGYATASVGKWSQLPLQPGDFGFDEYLRFTGSGKYWPTQEKSYVLNGENKPLHDGQYVPDVMHDFLVDFITRHHDQPCYVHYPMSHCHGPIQRTPDTPADAPRERFYADNVAYMDKLVGRLVAELGKLGLRERTLLLYTGDNGTAPGQAANATVGGRRLSGQKGTMHEGGVRVPLIANLPGVAPAGKVNRDLIDFSDILPTFAELAGAKLPDRVTIDGHSFAPQIRGEAGTPREWIYVELNGKHYVRTQRWKLTGTGELYDTKEAPFVETLVAPDAQDAEAKAAREHLQQVLRDLRAGATPTPITPARPRRGGANRRRRRRQ
ncbi:MAG: sulfatase-like hydrolase/transferase, partial [Armatimonadetes bacterium]|nr:sulfatase-like hydrolase/transferase [Armatimonadota bacterium]